MDKSIYHYFNNDDTSNENQDLSAFNGLPISDHVQAREYLTPEDLAQWRWSNVENLDIFLREVYEYYLGKGFFCIALSRVLKMATIMFVVIFSSYLYSCIDYSKLIGAQTLADIRRDHCLAQTSTTHRFLLWIFGIVWVLKLFQYISNLRFLWELHDFFAYLLKIDENEIQTISWQQVVQRIIKLRTSNLTTTNIKLDAHSIVNRIMRQENYMIGLYNKSVLDLNIELPFKGKQPFLTKTLEWSIDMCLSDYIFNDKGMIRPIVLQEDKRELLSLGLKRRFQFAAILNIILAPFAVFYATLYYFFRHFNDYKSDPKNLGARQYTPLAEWKFRELNELYHLFRRRISMSYEPAQWYISLFPREKTEIVLRFIIFICSSFAAVLGMLTVYDPEFLKLEIRPDQSVLFYLTSLGLAIAVARAMLSSPQDQAIYQPEAAMHQIAEFTHYLPEEWESKLHTEQVKQEFSKLYDMKLKIILRELLSIIINPIILGINLSNCTDTIIDYFREFSVDVESFGGHVCSLGVFNTDQISKVKAQSDALDQYYASQDGKMLKSYINFMNEYGSKDSKSQRPRNRYRRDIILENDIEEDTASIQSSHSERPIQYSQRLNASSRSAMMSSQTVPIRLNESVMDLYDKINDPQSSFLDNEETSQSPEDDKVNDGVLGILNNLYHK